MGLEFTAPILGVPCSASQPARCPSGNRKFSQNYEELFCGEEVPRKVSMEGRAGLNRQIKRRSARVEGRTVWVLQDMEKRVQLEQKIPTGE